MTTHTFRGQPGRLVQPSSQSESLDILFAGVLFVPYAEGHIFK